ncbi:polyvinylalcohol dehydrogenase-like [Salvia splendens]|uniref:polyvinylalcohol dehydrogenase-like n=1 Tax=Salvia splendens TaxID=180675 RepID=UPI001C258B01|nr:polyvinylalcohol dehydrogenase-like [Salvia splendens]
MANHGRNAIFVLALCFISFADNSTAEWLTHGRDISNRRSEIGGSINPISVRLGLLRQRWKFLAGFDITATPSVANGVVYFPSWNGNLYAVNAANGVLIWQRSLGQLTGIPPTGTYVNVTVSRSTPVVADDLLIVGIYGPAYVVAVTRSTGTLVWSTRVDPAPLGLVTASGTVYKGGFYVGVSSLEVTLPASRCCTFRGSLVKIDVKSGKILWQTYTLPDNGGKLGGYAGAAIWGSSPSIDTRRGLVYVGTGQLYIAPTEVLQCQARQNNRTTPPSKPDECFGPDIHFDSLMAFDLNSGRIVWARQLGGYDVFYFTCLVPNNPDCPTGPNLDADFGEAPMQLTILSNGRLRDVVVAVQKSGFAWALDRDNGDIVWSIRAGPGGLEGGGVWGAASDGLRVYTNIVNSNNEPFTLKPSTRNTTAGGWVAMDANTGKILWTTANPSNETAHGPVTIVNGVLFAGSVAPTGPVYAMDARTGAIIWTFETGATVYGGASSSYGCIFIGHGYTIGLARFHPTWTSGKYLFALCIP